MFYPRKMPVIISESCFENLNPVRCRQRLYAGFALLHGIGAENEGIKLVPILPSFLSSLDKTQ